MSTPAHIPVMLSEVLDYLQPQGDMVVIDGTVGLGGHTRAILTKLSPRGQVIGLDRDAETLRCCQALLPSDPRVTLVHASYGDLPSVLEQQAVPGVNGMLLDLGLSSFQLDYPDRGFSFRQDAPLDMRFDQTTGEPVSHWLRRTDEKTIADCLFTYGEERYSKRIARQIKRSPAMETVQDLKEAIRKSTPPAFRHKSFARVFQALRIVVNQELDHLDRFLSFFTDYLLPGGRIVIITYHSLEDRLVKHRFRDAARRELIQLLTKKATIPSDEEIQNNPRARSAKLRAALKMA
ncbi:MAG: 16S rRNA (cytosine(1402)-N(4))-methyltransferase RsmH [Candidatus Neomarinimicrobiota bacterium]|nr:MAG: 16S rRNA (cytosine(1402)-N(4))-methyltransferase RsmH [Candidatus Neomarinimicrobiota bacterium]